VQAAGPATTAQTTTAQTTTAQTTTAQTTTAQTASGLLAMSSAAGDVAKQLQALGGARVFLATVTSSGRGRRQASAAGRVETSVRTRAGRYFS
jgi:hypothetical protein